MGLQGPVLRVSYTDICPWWKLGREGSEAPPHSASKGWVKPGQGVPLTSGCLGQFGPNLDQGCPLVAMCGPCTHHVGRWWAAQWPSLNRRAERTGPGLRQSLEMESQGPEARTQTQNSEFDTQIPEFRIRAQNPESESRFPDTKI